MVNMPVNYVETHKHANTCTHTHTHTHAHARIHTRTHTHIHTPVRLLYLRVAAFERLRDCLLKQLTRRRVLVRDSEALGQDSCRLVHAVFIL